MQGELRKVEVGALGGQSGRRVWAVTSPDQPLLFWYKARGDVVPLGRVSLALAAFTFDPRSRGHLQVIAQSGGAHESLLFDAGGPDLRARWLAALQACRKNAYPLADPADQEPLVRSADDSDLMSFEVIEEADAPETEKSKFYLDKAGALVEDSLVPPPQAPPGLVSGLRHLLHEPAASTSADETPTGASHGASRLPRLPSVRRSPSKLKACAGCAELLSVVENLKGRFADVADENAANKELVAILRTNLLTSKAQVQSMADLAELSSDKEQVAKFLDSEKESAALRHLEREKNQRMRSLEEELATARRDLQAYKDSLRSKEELIMSLVESGGGGGGGRGGVVGEGAEEVLVEEGVELDSGGRHSVLLAGETEVEDLNRVEHLKTAAEAYRSQNAFLNKEVLQLQGMVASMEAREKAVVKNNFELEGALYQLKSKYLLLLNHLRPSSGHQNSLGLAGAEIEALIGDATRNVGDPKGSANPQDLLPLGDEARGPGRREEREADALGFYVTEEEALRGPLAKAVPNESGGVDLVRTAAALSRRARGLAPPSPDKAGEVEWLGRWDAAVVALSDGGPRPSGQPAQDLKALLRTSIPHNYRARVWSALLEWLVGPSERDMGKGYFHSLLKKSLARRGDGGGDAALKQIDLDLPRTLPGNRHFEREESGKMESLRRVLYAYRWHNTSVGYCQGLNRLAAVGLLYLSEERAFWFLVAVVECQQPEDYYSPTLATAVADQRVLADLVVEKLPRLGAHLRSLDTELSLFTLPWFLTAFVDSLPPRVYLPIFDVLLGEGNKVLFRFALALLKLCEPRILACASPGALQSLLSKLGSVVPDYPALAHVAFHDLNPFPLKTIETRRTFHLAQIKAEQR